MTLEHRIATFTQLGEFLSQFSTTGILQNKQFEDQNNHFELFRDAIHLAHIQNPWFTEANILYSLESWSGLLY